VPRRYEMSALVERCQQRADLENDGHIASAEWKALISEQYGELFNAVSETGLRYFETTATLTTTGATYVAEPEDHFSTLRLDYLVDGTVTGQRRTLDELMSQEQAVWSGHSGSSEARAYALVDDRIYLYPTPPSGQLYEILYIPQSPDLSAYADDDVIDVVSPDGEAFLIWGVTVKALAKSESDVRLAIAEREAARERLTAWATMRAFSQPRRLISGSFDGPLSGYDPADWRFR
jgi:hypothetical protein